MKLLLSNDDGVNAPGLRTLHRELCTSFHTTVVAPLEERSTTGHSLSLDKPLRLERLEDSIYGCSGFPADCVLMGLGHLMREERPDLVVSGINRGANLAQDLYYSGTIAAAREAAFHGIPALAVSLAFEHMTDPAHYEAAAKVVRLLVESRISQVIPKFTLINVNVPNKEWRQLRGCKLTEIGFRRYSEQIHARMDARNREYYWIGGLYEGHSGATNSDCRAVDEGFVSVTPHALIDGCERDYTKLLDLIGKLNAALAS